MSPRLLVHGLTAGYANRPVLKDLDLPPIAAGEVVSLIGPNAAGKTTLLRALAGLLPAKGSVILDGREMVGVSLAERAQAITYMPQTLPQGVALTVMETVISAMRASPLDGAVVSDHEAAEAAVTILSRVGIDHLAMEGLDHLSGGQRQLAGLAQALARRPRLLLLDEPTSALDLHHALKVLNLVRSLAAERGMAVLMVLHDLQAAARASDRVVMLSHGQVAAVGAPHDAITPESLAKVYKVRARVRPCEEGTLQIMVDDVIE